MHKILTHFDVYLPDNYNAFLIPSLPSGVEGIHSHANLILQDLQPSETAFQEVVTSDTWQPWKQQLLQKTPSFVPEPQKRSPKSYLTQNKPSKLENTSK